MPTQQKLLAFGKADRHIASSRYRLWLLTDAWKEKGLDVEILLKENVEALGFTQLLHKCRQAQAIYLQRPLYPKFSFLKLVAAILISRTRVIFDFDDAVYEHSFAKWLVLTLISDRVVVGSKKLFQHAKKWNKNIDLIPTGVPGWLYTQREKTSDKPTNESKMIIGWIGNGPAHIENLRLLISPFKKLQELKFSFEFRLIGAVQNPAIYDMFQFLGTSFHPIDQLDWKDATQAVQEIKKFDVGLMPLEDTEWNQGKCAFKAIEYMACGVPALVSDVGENNVLMEGELQKLLMHTPEDWTKAILLFSNQETGNYFGELCREHIAKHYFIENLSQRYLALLFPNNRTDL